METASKKIVVHWVKIPPKQRSSTPHAESLEEEFVYVVSGNPHLWINGYIYQLEPKIAVGFPAGTGICHTFINNTNEDVEVVVIGERTKKDNHWIYPVNPELYEKHKNSWWQDWPKQEIGPHLGVAGDLNHQRDWRQLSFVKKVSELSHADSFSYSGDNETFTEGTRLTNHLGLNFLGIWHETMQPGRRSSWPHAHKMEEEFIVQLKGHSDVWLNGHVHQLNRGQVQFFPPGVNLAHVVMNNGAEGIEFLGVGEADSAGELEKIIYPLSPARNQQCKDKGTLWEDAPARELGPHNGLPVVRGVEIQKLESIEPLKEILIIREAEYSLLLGVKGNSTFLGVFSHQKLIGGCMVNERNLVVSLIPGPLLVPLAKYLFAQNFKFPGVVGPPFTAETFARVWSEISGSSYRENMSQKIYRLIEVNLPKDINGELLVADDSHADLLAQWTLEFGIEAGLPDVQKLEAAREYSSKKIKNKDFYLWRRKDGEIVSMNSVGRATDHGISISAVYTPKKFRGSGYASQLVAATSQKMLDQGRKFCVLYTDMSNPTSNKIYQRIGYQEVATSKHFVFGPS